MMKKFSNLKKKIAALVCGISLLCGTPFYANAVGVVKILHITIGGCTYFVANGSGDCAGSISGIVCSDITVDDVNDVIGCLCD